MLPPELMTQAERIVLAMQQEAARYTSAVTIELAAVQFVSVTDPVNQLPSYAGSWRNARNERCGSLNLNSDGSFYAEFDLFCPHPGDPRWCAEMVTAWGRGESLSCETTLIPSL